MDLLLLFQYSLNKVIETFSNIWYLLLLSVIISAALNFMLTRMPSRASYVATQKRVCLCPQELLLRHRFAHAERQPLYWV
jgi:hypothetical protein